MLRLDALTRGNTGGVTLHPPTMGVVYFTPNYETVYFTPPELSKTGQITPRRFWNDRFDTVTMNLVQ
jgi:hypothetical protein